MSTEIKSQTDADRVFVLRGDLGDVYAKTATSGVWINRADFLKAVADELDVIVVERSELPEVTRDGDEWLASHAKATGTWMDDKIATADALRGRAAECLALAEYLDANPPVDEAQVEAWTRILTDVEMDHPDGPTPSTIARRLVEKGIRVREVTP